MNVLCKLGLHRWRANYVERKEFRTTELVLLPFGFAVRPFFFPIEPTNLWPCGEKCTRCGMVRR